MAGSGVELGGSKCGGSWFVENEGGGWSEMKGRHCSFLVRTTRKSPFERWGGVCGCR